MNQPHTFTIQSSNDIKPLLDWMVAHGTARRAFPKLTDCTGIEKDRQVDTAAPLPVANPDPVWVDFPTPQWTGAQYYVRCLENWRNYYDSKDKNVGNRGKAEAAGGGTD